MWNNIYHQEEKQLLAQIDNFFDHKNHVILYAFHELMTKVNFNNFSLMNKKGYLTLTAESCFDNSVVCRSSVSQKI